MKALWFKDWANAKRSIFPAALLGVSVLLILQFLQGPEQETKIHWIAAFWVAYFFSATSLFYRGFGLEHRFRSFIIYSSLRTSRLQIFASQAMTHFFSLLLLGAFYLGLVFFFWSPRDVASTSFILPLILVSFALSPLGTLLGLALQIEREFLFSVIFFPLITPLILGAYVLSQEYSLIWASLLTSFGLISTYLCALLFRFFFEDLSQS